MTITVYLETLSIKEAFAMSEEQIGGHGKYINLRRAFDAAQCRYRDDDLTHYCIVELDGYPCVVHTYELNGKDGSTFHYDNIVFPFDCNQIYPIQCMQVQPSFKVW